MKSTNANNYIDLIPYGDWLYVLLSMYRDEEKYKKFHKQITEKTHPISTTEESYRVINHWDEKKLLLDSPDREAGWRKFSLLDILWISIIRELRSVGLGIPEITTAKHKLFECFSFNESTDTTYFEVFMMLAYTRKADISLIVLPDGNSALTNEEDLQSAEALFSRYKTFIKISINTLLAEILKNPELGKKNTHLLSLDEKQTELLIKPFENDNLKSANLTYREGKLEKIDFVYDEQNPEDLVTKIHKLLKDKERKEIIIKQEDGGKVTLLRNVSKK